MVGCGARSARRPYGWQASAWPLRFGQAEAAAEQPVLTGRHQRGKRRRCRSRAGPVRVGSAYIGLAQLETAARANIDLVAPAAARRYEHAVRSGLPEFLAWALVYQAESGDHAKVPLARRAAAGIANPVLQARVQALPAGEACACRESRSWL
jgi:hypothetical protein